MKPGQYDLETAKEMVGDFRVRAIEKDARDAAEDNRDCPLDGVLRSAGNTYFDTVMLEMECRIWHAAHQKRKDRLERMAQQ